MGGGVDGRGALPFGVMTRRRVSVDICSLDEWNDDGSYYVILVIFIQLFLDVIVSNHNILYYISDRIAGMASAADSAGGDRYGQLADTNLTNSIQRCLLTKIISPRVLLSTCFTCFRLTVPSNSPPPSDQDATLIQKVISYISFGNHATIVCRSANAGKPEGRITANLEGEVLQAKPGVTTRRYDEAVGVAQPVFSHSIDKLKDLFVLGKGHIQVVPKQLEDWETNWPYVADFIMDELNNGIADGREDFKNKLKVLFEKIRTLDDSDPKTHEIRAKYCTIAMDLLRNDIFRSFGSTIQKGILATINIHNSSDEYTRHHGKLVTDPMLTKAAYNVLILVNVVIGEGLVYTIHMEIDRGAVEQLLTDAFVSDRVSKADKYQSASYWIGDVIKWIHENVYEFFQIVKNVLDTSVPTMHVAPHIGSQHYQYLLRKMEEMSPDLLKPVKFHQAIYVSGCKCFTLYDPTLEFKYADDSPNPETSIIVTTPNTDMTVGNYKLGDYFVSVKPIKVLSSDGEITITDVNFTLPTNFFHVPTYDESYKFLNEVFKPFEGDTFGSFQSRYTPDSGSLQMQQNVSHNALEEEAAAAAKAEAVAAAEADLDMKPVVDNLIQELKDDITEPTPDKSPLELVEKIVSTERAKPGILKQALNTICGTFHYLLSPFTSLQRLGVVTPLTELLDADTSMRISIVLCSSWNYFENDRSKAKLVTQLQALTDGQKLETELKTQSAKNEVLRSRLVEIENQIQSLQKHIEDINEILTESILSISEIIALPKLKRGQDSIDDDSVTRVGSLEVVVRSLTSRGGMRRSILRRSVKKNTRRNRSIRSRRCRRHCQDCWQYSSSSSSGNLKKNTQRCRSRNSKTTRRRRTTATRA